ncbi:MAG TPA: FAD-dependent oxidoreductase, partial [Gemmatimonadaceae bacterium]|nr:FAD-dependent oxidoreductase [Gemmatimonadaceae bacterium]
MTDRLKDNALRAANKSQRRRPSRLRRPLRAISAVVIALVLFGIVLSALSIFRVYDARVKVRSDSSVRVTEVTHLYPVLMRQVVAPRTVQEIAAAVKSSPGPISIGGGRNSMGGQTATPDGLQIDMRNFRGIVAFDSAARTITVHSGTRWREVQDTIDKYGLAVKIMQTYNTFTVGGALSVNAHG